MQTRTKLFRMIFIAMLGALLMVSCSAEDGATGPPGPIGPQGEQGDSGDQGDPGEDGDQGEPGTANVIYSDWFDTELDNNIVATTSSFEISAPEIDANILNFGTILVYARRLDPVTFAPYIYNLPIVFGAARQQSYYFRATSDIIRIIVVANEEGESAGDGTFLQQYRYVIIPGGTPATDPASKSYKDWSKMSYQEVAEYFNIKE